MPRPLGRTIDHDPRNRAHDVETRLANVPIRAVEWTRHSKILDQGTIGSCTGNAMAGWLGCEPHCTDPLRAALYDERLAVTLYSAATRLDRCPGHYDPADPDSQDTGSSGLAVAKAAKRAKLISAYTWAFSTRGLLRALQHGPVLVGSEWPAGFDEPDRYGVVTPAGVSRGGHEYLVRGYRPDDGGGWLLCSNSWGPGWGLGGEFLMSLATWEWLRGLRADVTVPHI